MNLLSSVYFPSLVRFLSFPGLINFALTPGVKTSIGRNMINDKMSTVFWGVWLTISYCLSSTDMS